MIGAKLSRIKHDLHSIKKGNMTIKEYVSKVQNTCALLEALRHQISKSERVKIVLVSFSPKFNAMITLASFLSEPLPMRNLIDILLEYESRQNRMVYDTLLQANLVGPRTMDHGFSGTMKSLIGGCTSYGGCGQSTRGRVQCQICGRMGHLAQRYFYRYD